MKTIKDPIEEALRMNDEGTIFNRPLKNSDIQAGDILLNDIPKGDERGGFNEGEICFDIITGKQKIQVEIIEIYNEIGWSKYVVKDLTGRIYILRNKDLSK